MATVWTMVPLRPARCPRTLQRLTCKQRTATRPSVRQLHGLRYQVLRFCCAASGDRNDSCQLLNDDCTPNAAKTFYDGVFNDTTSISNR